MATEQGVTLLDTPGHPDFVGAVDCALAIADVAVIVVSAVDGVTGGTRAAWARAEAAGVPRIIVVTQEDRARADFRRTVEQLRDAFGPGLWPIELPIGEEHGFRGVVDVVSERALVYDESSRHHDEPTSRRHRRRGAPPASGGDRGDRLARRCAAGGLPRGHASRRRASSSAPSRMPSRRRQAVPIVLCSALTGTGVDHVADLICELAPVRRLRTTAASSSEATTRGEAAPSTASHPIPRVRRSSTCSARSTDPFVGQVAMFKVLSGVVRPGDRLRNTTTGVEERMPGALPPARRRASARRRLPGGRGGCGREAHRNTGGLAAVDASAGQSPACSAARARARLRRRLSSRCRNPTTRS